MDPIDYGLIPQSELHPEAKRIAIVWMEGFEEWMASDIWHKHKLASDIMNFADAYHQEKLKELREVE